MIGQLRQVWVEALPTFRWTAHLRMTWQTCLCDAVYLKNANGVVRRQAGDSRERACMAPTHWPHTLETLQLAWVNVFACYERSAVKLNSCFDGVWQVWNGKRVWCCCVFWLWGHGSVCSSAGILYKLNIMKWKDESVGKLVIIDHFEVREHKVPFSHTRQLF